MLHRVAVVGNVDAGKSTLLGVLTHGELDNGRGTARMKLFRHKHEMETGRTSSVGNDILGFDSQGRLKQKYSQQMCRVMLINMRVMGMLLVSVDFVHFWLCIFSRSTELK